MSGYNVFVLPAVDKKAVDVGLKLVNNDACYPSIIVIGQLINALKSGEYDLNNTSLMISQTRGRVPGYKLYRFYKESFEGCRLRPHPRNILQCGRPGKAARI